MSAFLLKPIRSTGQDRTPGSLALNRAGQVRDVDAARVGGPVCGA
jgi:hypothetical protein